MAAADVLPLEVVGTDLPADAQVGVEPDEHIVNAVRGIRGELRPVVQQFLVHAAPASVCPRERPEGDAGCAADGDFGGGAARGEEEAALLDAVDRQFHVGGTGDRDAFAHLDIGGAAGEFRVGGGGDDVIVVRVVKVFGIGCALEPAQLGRVFREVLGQARRPLATAKRAGDGGRIVFFPEDVGRHAPDRLDFLLVHVLHVDSAALGWQRGLGVGGDEPFVGEEHRTEADHGRVARVTLVFAVHRLTGAQPAVFFGADARRVPVDAFGGGVDIDFARLVVGPEPDAPDDRVFARRGDAALGRVEFAPVVEHAGRSVGQNIDPAHRHREPLRVGFAAAGSDDTVDPAPVIFEAFDRIPFVRAHRARIGDREHEQRLVQVVRLGGIGRDRGGVHVDPLVGQGVPVGAQILRLHLRHRFRLHDPRRVQLHDAAQRAVVAVHPDAPGLARPRQVAAVGVELGGRLTDLRDRHVDRRVRQRPRLEVFRILDRRGQFVARHREKRCDQHCHQQDDRQYGDQRHAFLL